MTALKKFALALLAIGLMARAADAGVMYAPSYFADALLDMGDGPYEEESNLTAGGARPWYESPVVHKLYGGKPNAAQRWEFSAKVYERTESAFHRSGLPLDLTNNPNDIVPHAMSVVSNTHSPTNPQAIGISTINGSGFSFIDGLKYARNADELATAVAHNVAHELLHAFGGGHYDTTGRYLDAAVTDWSTLINPNATFSPEAVADMSTKNFRAYRGMPSMDLFGGWSWDWNWGWGYAEVHGPECPDCQGAQMTAVPEPATIGLWSFALVGGIWYRRRARKVRVS